MPEFICQTPCENVDAFNGLQSTLRRIVPTFEKPACPIAIEQAAELGYKSNCGLIAIQMVLRGSEELFKKQGIL